MLLTSCGKLRCRRPNLHTSGSTVEANAILGSCLVDDVVVVDVVDDSRVHVGNTRVVVVVEVPPVTAIESPTGITKSVINASVEADDRPPIAGIPDV